MEERKSIDYKCKVCNKYYKTYQTLWKHNKKFHCEIIKNSHIKSDIKYIKSDIKHINNIVENNKSLTCENCNKIFNSRSAKSHHKKVCKIMKEKILLQIKENEILKLKYNNQIELLIKKEELLKK